MSESSVPGPLARHDQGPVFEEAWQAQILAVAANLVEQQVISANDWSQAFGAELQRASTSGEPDNRATYYQAALTALEGLLAVRNMLPGDALETRIEDWRSAYLRTPHGQPVEL